MRKKDIFIVIIGIVIVFAIFGKVIFDKIPKEKQQAKLTNTKELKQKLGDKQLKNIKEGLYTFSKNNDLHKNFTYKSGSLDVLTDVRFNAYVQNNKNQREIILVKYNTSKDIYLIDFAYHPGSVVKNSKEIKEVYSEPDYVKIYNKEVLEPLTFEEQERIPDSINDFVYNHDIEYTFYYITKIDITKNKITFSAKALNNRLFCLEGTVNRQTQDYTYKQIKIVDKEAEEEESKWQNKIRG